VREDIERTLRLRGCPAVAALNPSYLQASNSGTDAEVMRRVPYLEDPLHTPRVPPARILRG
jgi:hypothetical protein